MLHGELQRAVGHVVKQPLPSAKPGQAVVPAAYAPAPSDPFGSQSQSSAQAAGAGSPADFTASFWVFFQIHHQAKQVGLSHYAETRGYHSRFL